MHYKFLTNLILVLVLNVLVKPFYIVGIDAEFLNRIEAHSKGDYGIYFSLLGLTFMLNIFLDFGINNYNTRQVARDSNWIHKQFATLLSVRMGLVFIYFIILFFAGWILEYNQTYFGLLAILGLNQILVAFILFFRSNITGLLMFRIDSVVSILDRLVLVIICSVILWSNWYPYPITIYLFAWIQTFAYALTLIVCVGVLIPKIKQIKLSFDQKQAKIMIQQSAPYALLILLMMVYYRMDSVMIERMLNDGARQAALYAQGFRFFEAFSMLGYLFAGLLLPIFSNLLKNKQSVNPITNFSSKLLFSGALIICCVMWHHKTELIAWRYDTSSIENYSSALSFGILMIAFVGMCLTYVYGTLLTANGNLNQLNKMALIGVIVNFVLNYILIPEFGIIGASWASMVTQLLTAFVQIVLAFKLLKLRVSKSEIIKTISFSLLIAILFIGLPHQISANLGISILITLALGLVAAFITKMIDLKGMLKIIKQKMD